jgi:hypothetical protein
MPLTLPVTRLLKSIAEAFLLLALIATPSVASAQCPTELAGVGFRRGRLIMLTSTCDITARR